MKELGSKSIKSKITLLVLGIAIFTILSVQSYNLYNAYLQNILSLNKTEELMLKDYDTNIKNHVQLVLSMIDTNEKIQAASGVPLEERKNNIREILRDMRYAKDGYFWIDTYEGLNILLPPNPASEGKNRYELQDVNKKFLIKEIIENGRKPEGGYSDYWFPKPGEKEASPKRSYSISYDKYRWVIGTGNYIDDIQKAVEQQRSILKKAFVKSIVMTGFILLAVIFLTIIGAVMIANSLANPIKYTSAFIGQITAGDLTNEVTSEYLRKKDEIGIMLNALSQFEKKLNEVLGEINRSAVQISSNFEQASATALNFSDGAQRQAASVEEINATIEEVSAGVDMINDNANNQFNNVKLLMESVEKLKSIESSIRDKSETVIRSSKIIGERSDESNSSLRLMQQEFREINESSQKMMEMVNFINGIADQINLLSLNAAIESARAGDAGRGFAVVADEISKLAEATSSNVKQIQETIKINDDKIKKGTGILVESLNKQENVIKEICDISDLIVQVSGSIEEQSVISDQVSRETRSVREKSEQIALAIEEQKLAFGEIASSIAVINQETQTNASGADEIAGSSKHVAEMTHSMIEKISYFKLREKKL